MKYCPSCQTKYADDTLQFCLQDGTELTNFNNQTSAPTIAFDEQETVIKNRSAQDRKKSQETTVTTPKQIKTNKIIIALSLIAGFGLLFLFWQQSKTKVEQMPVANSNSAKMPDGMFAPPINLGNVSIGNAETPTDAYKMLYAAVKAKNTEAIKRMMSQTTLGFAEGAAAQQNTPLPKFFENGLTATTFAANLPRTRDQRVKDNMGAVEVWNETDKRWEDLPFVKEADGWKLAVGDIFAGTHQSPGKGQAQIEAEASTNNAIPYSANTSGNFSTAKPEMPAKPNK